MDNYSHRRTAISGALALSVFAATLLIASFIPAAAHADDYVIRKGDRLSVDFRAAPLHLIQRLLDRDAHISLRLPAAVRDRSVSVSFHDVAVGSAIDMLLKAAALGSHASIFGPAPEHRITVVVVESGEIGPAVASDSPTSAGADATTGSQGHPLTREMHPMLSPPPA